MLRRALQVALVVANVVVVSVWLLLGEGETIHPVGTEGLPSALWIVLWWSSPALTLFFHQTWAGTLLTGVALVVASNVALLGMYSSTSSTAAIGFYAVPSLGWLMAIVLLGAEWIFRPPWWP